MALERNVSPIPPGRYWLDVIGAANIEDFLGWVADMRGAVVVETTEVDRESTPLEDYLARGVNPSRLFVIFRVPVGRFPFLNAMQFGFPNKAPANVQASSDTVQRPDVDDPFGRFTAETGDLLKLALVGAIIYFVATSGD